MTDKVRIYMNRNVNMSKGKYAAHAVHAALVAAGVEYPGTVVVLSASKTAIEGMPTVIHDNGVTELKPGTLTAGTEWEPDKGNVEYGCMVEDEGVLGFGWDRSAAQDEVSRKLDQGKSATLVERPLTTVWREVKN